MTEYSDDWVQPVSEERRRRMRKLSDWHREWDRRYRDAVPFQPAGRADLPDYNLHFVDLDAPREIENEYNRRANEILGLDPEGGVLREDPLTASERFKGSLLGGALGDAFGYPIKHDSIVEIRNALGQRGLTEQPLRDGSALVSGNTQLMLFTLEGLVRGRVARRTGRAEGDPIPEIQHAYQRWLHTQDRPWQQAPIRSSWNNRMAG